MKRVGTEWGPRQEGGGGGATVEREGAEGHAPGVSASARVFGRTGVGQRDHGEGVKGRERIVNIVSWDWRKPWKSSRGRS